MLNVGIYVRYSVDCGVAERIAEDLKKFVATREDWNLVDVYIDIGYTAKDENRPELKRIISDCMSGKLNAIVLNSTCAISRNDEIILKLLKDFQPLGVDIFERKSDMFLRQGLEGFGIFQLHEYAKEYNPQNSFFKKSKEREIKNFLDYLFKVNHDLVKDKEAIEEGFVVSLGKASVNVPIDGISYNVIVRAIEEIYENYKGA